MGIGIFVTPSEVAKYLSSPCMIILAWIAGGVISLLGALCYAEISASFPKTGGNYIYLRESYGPLTGFLFGWTELLVIRTGSVAAVAFIFAEYLKSLLSIKGDLLLKPIAIFSILILAIINLVGLRQSKRIQNISVIVKVIAIISLVVFGVLFKKGDIAHFHCTPVTAPGGILPLFGLALIPILWTYGGWHENTFMAGETKDAQKTIAFALVTGVCIISFLYVVINCLYLYLLSPGEMARTGSIGSEVMRILCGRTGEKLFDVFIIISSLGCLNAMIMTGSRVTYAMAKDNIIFRFIGKVNARHGTPVMAIIINSAWAILLVVLGTFNKLLAFTGIAVWLFFALAVGGLFILRYKFPDIERPYKVPGFPLTPIVFIVVCIALFINTLLYYSVQSAIGLCIIMSGVPVFIVSGKIIEKGKDR